MTIPDGLPRDRQTTNTAWSTRIIDNKPVIVLTTQWQSRGGGATGSYNEYYWLGTEVPEHVLERDHIKWAISYSEEQAKTAQEEIIRLRARLEKLSHGTT